MRRLFSVCLTGVLSIGIAALPIAPALHDLTARHVHRYCYEHQLLEEVPRSTVAGNRAAPPRVSETSSTGVAKSGPQVMTQHVACVAANWTSGRVWVPCAPRLTPALKAPSNNRSNPTGWVHRALPILAEAPKSSPPALLV